MLIQDIMMKTHYLGVRTKVNVFPQTSKLQVIDCDFYCTENYTDRLIILKVQFHQNPFSSNKTIL